MEARRYQSTGKQRVWFSPVLLAVVLMPAFLQTQYTCERPGNTRLSSLEFEVQGVNRLAFDPTLRAYEVWLPSGATSVTIRAQAADPAAYTTWYVQAGGGTSVSGQLGVGGGEVTLDLPPDGNSLGVGVYPSGGAIGKYTVTINPVCPEADPCHNGGHPGVCVSGVCELPIVDFCIDQPVACNASGECLTDGLCDPSCDPIDAASGLCARCSGQDDAVPDGTACGTDGFCEAGACRERSWGTPVQLDGNGGCSSRATNAHVAMDANGNAVAVWYDCGSTYSNRYSPATGWGTAETITAPGTFPRVAMDADGNAMVVYRRYASPLYDNWSNRYSPATGWGTDELLETDDMGSTWNPEIAMNANGNAVAVWKQDDNEEDLQSAWSIWANNYSPATGWGAAELIETDDTAGADDPQVAMADNGNAAVVWSQGGTWANLYSPATGWGTAHLIGDGGSCDIAMDSNGNAVVVWVGATGIWSNRYSLENGWGAAELIETNDACRAPKVAMADNGNAVVAWHRYDGSALSIWANNYSPATGWGAAELIETDDTAGAYDPQVAMADNGNAVVAWVLGPWTGRGGTGLYALGSNRYSPASGWGTAETIGTAGLWLPSHGIFPVDPHVAMDSNGNAVVVWNANAGPEPHGVGATNSHLNIYSIHYE